MIAVARVPITAAAHGSLRSASRTGHDRPVGFHATMFTQPPLPQAEDLPNGIDVAWVATRAKRLGQLCERLWRRPRGAHWEQLA